MEDAKFPLTYKTSTLIEVLQERLQKRVDDRAAAKAKLDEKNQKARDQVVALLDEYPSFLVWVTNQVRGNWGHDAGSDALRETIEKTYGTKDEVPADNYDPDEDLNRLIRVYEKAEDKEVKVTVRDEVFAYL